MALALALGGTCAQQSVAQQNAITGVGYSTPIAANAVSAYMSPLGDLNKNSGRSALFDHGVATGDFGSDGANNALWAQSQNANGIHDRALALGHVANAAGDLSRAGRTAGQRGTPRPQVGSYCDSNNYYCLTVTKTLTNNSDPDGSGNVTQGDVLTFQVSATNTGNFGLTLNNVQVNDPLTTPNTTTCASLAPNATCTLTGTYTVTAADAANGSITNTGTATAIEFSGGVAADTLNTPVFGTAAMSITKVLTGNTDPDGSGTVTQGDVLTFTVTGINSGNTTLNSVTVGDALTTPNSRACASLVPGASCVLAGTYTVTAADAANGSISNTGTAVSKQTPSIGTTINTPVNSNPAMTVSKALTGNTDPDNSGTVTPGDVLTFTVTGTNSGNTVLNGVNIGDALTTPNSTSCGSLAVGANCVLTGTYTVTPADATNGSINNTGTAASQQTPLIRTALSTPVSPTPAPAMTVTKLLTGSVDNDSSGSVTPGDQLNYSVTATNTGNVPLTSVVVSDNHFAGTNTCAAVPVSGTCALVGSYIVTTADATTGSVTNIGSATSTQVPGPTTSTVSTPVLPTPAPAMSVAKLLTGSTDPDGSGSITQGDVLTYAVTATNTGNIALTNVTVNDPLTVPGSTSCPNVAVGATCVLTGTHTVTAADVAAGSISNTGNATSTQVPGPINSNPVNTPIASSPAMSVAKALTGNSDPDGSGTVTQGDVLTYVVTATDTGNVPLTNVTVNDSLTAPASSSCPNVAIGATCVLTGTHVVTATDVSNGSINNTGTATSTQVAGPISSNAVNTLVAGSPRMSVTKAMTANSDPDRSGTVTQGDVLTYVVTATNAGNVPLSNVTVNDSLASPNTASCPNVAIGATCVLTGAYTVTAANVAAGSISNTGSATSTQVPGPINSNTVNTPVAGSAAMSVTKALTGNSDPDGSGTVTLGDALTYTVTALNIGNLALTNVIVNDPLTAPGTTTCPNVPVGGACVLTGIHTVTAADVAAGMISNLGNATSTQVSGPVNSNTVNTPIVAIVNATLTIVSGDSQNLVPGVASEPLVVQLSANGNPVVGAVINWTASNATLSNAPMASRTNAASTSAVVVSSTSLTDANGRASKIATVVAAGPASVTAASVAPPAGPVSFTVNGGIANLSGLTPEQHQVAIALDNACPALAALSTLTPAQQDLLLRCQEIEQSAASNPSQVQNALTQLFASSAFLQSTAALEISASQFDNIKARIAALRSGTGGQHFGGLALNTPNGGFPIGSSVDALLGASDKKKDEVGAGFERWGFFAAGTLGRATVDPSHVLPGYNFDTTGLTAGVDYRYSDSWIFGATAGFARFTSSLDGGGHLNTRGWSLSAYSTLFRQNSWYVDGVLTWGHNSYDINRRIFYSVTTPAGTTTIDTRATANTAGSNLAGSLTVGRDFQKGPWSIGPYFRGNLAQLSFNDYRESLPAGAPGSGLGLDVKSRDVQSASSVLGGKFTYASSQSWGVLMPHMQVEWEHEFKSDPYRLEAHFLNDPTATPILVQGDALDNDFFRLGFGLSFIFTGGKSGFVYYEKTLGRQGITQDNLALGIRLEF